MTGTAFFEGVTVLFLARAFGVQLALPQQVTVVNISEKELRFPSDTAKEIAADA